MFAVTYQAADVTEHLVVSRVPLGSVRSPFLFSIQTS